MVLMFYHSKFNGDISKWDVSEDADISKIFHFSALEDSGKIPEWYNMRKCML